MKRLFTILLCTVLLLTACASPESANTDDTHPERSAVTGPTLPISVEPAAPVREDIVSVANFALDLLREQKPGEQNTLLSPLSLLAALGMTANGANGETLVQMERVLGIDTLRLCAIMPTLLTENDQLHLANGIWYRDTGMTVFPEFLATCTDYYAAAAKPTPMDESTRQEINAFIAEHTKGMIPDMLPEKSIDQHIVTLLVNALAFKAEWTVKYPLYKNTDEPFAGIDGTVTYMNSTERLYLEDNRATGFIKPYLGDRYAFAAILPNENVSLETYLAELDGKTLIDLLDSVTDTTVLARLPKFTYDYDANLAESLAAIGMPDAFDGGSADFTRLGRAIEGNIFIEKVLHRTHITVGEKGTEAAAATAIVMVPETAWIPPEDAKEVYLTRPFLYMIIDQETALPVFIGTLVDPK